MAFYDNIADHWHKQTGGEGGAVKRFLLNPILMQEFEQAQASHVLELAAGNGYFPRFLHKQGLLKNVTRYVVTDHSEKLLTLARRHNFVRICEYQQLELCQAFPFEQEQFDLLIANMVFNELGNRCFASALSECCRVLKDQGKLLGSVVHPMFVESLLKRNLIRNGTMPGSAGLRLPVVMRKEANYHKVFTQHGFSAQFTAIHTNEELLAEKPGLKNIGNTPVAMVFSASKLAG